jgi:2-dehydro-3-deoxyphosphooctonate aldolase (KDO 8-P synthase)
VQISLIPKINYGDSGNFLLIAGPCVVEDEIMPFRIAEKVFQICNTYQIPYIFKASYRKANRSRYDSFTGIGDEKAMKVIRDVGDRFNIPVLTDVHTEEEAEIASQYVDILQIPAFLCRQTELLVAAGRTGKAVNIKKGQFVSASAMKYAIDKVYQTGNEQVLLTERGTTFGYHDLIVDFRNIPEMQTFNVPVIVDVTHSLQQPNQLSGITGGRPDLISTIARAAIAVGADGIFLETHPEPEHAKSDGANMLRMDLLESILETLLRIRKAL